VLREFYTIILFAVYVHRVLVVCGVKMVGRSHLLFQLSSAMVLSALVHLECPFFGFRKVSLYYIISLGLHRVRYHKPLIYW
jgi:hypothetical protein